MNIKKTLLGILLAVVILLPVFSFLGPKRAQADFSGVIDAGKWVWEKVEVVYDKIQGIVGAQLANETLKMYMNTFAHDIATELATGGPGGKPQFRVDTIKKSLQKAQDAAIGEFLGELTSKSFADLGINLCDPSLDVKLTVTLALIDEQSPPKVTKGCDWRDVQRKWKNFATDFTDPNDPFGGLTKAYLDPSGGGQKWNSFWDSFSLEQSDFGVYSKLNERAKELEQEAKEAKTAEQIECQGYIDVGTTVTEQVKTHCSAILNLSESQFDSSIDATQEQLKIAQREDATKLSDIIKQAASNFMNTFTSKLLNNYIQKGMWSLFGQDENIYSQYKSSILDQLRGGGNILQPRGQDIFQEFKKVSIEPVLDYSFLESFAICPAQKDFRQPDNCVMNASFLQAITAKRTIQEAIDEGLINGNSSLIGPDDILRNNSDDCYRDAFCYHNLIKLRKANIIPIGWELAAERSSATDPVTIQKAIDCFEDDGPNCEYAEDSDYDNHNPFYHLVDADWVLKSPQALCEAFIYSSTLESSESSSRQQSCVDAKFCLREDDSGNCLDNQYGYCTRTENIWRFGADICQEGEIYSGCLTFDNEDIGSNSYIEGSLDYCTSDEAGCRRYSQDLSFDGQWILTDIESDEDDLFLNRRTTECTSDEAGCSEYIVLSADRGINSVPNGDFEQDVLNASGIASADGVPDGWSSGFLEYDGDRVAAPYTFGGGGYVREKIVLLPNTTYVLSASAAQYVPGDNDVARVVVSACDITGACNDYDPDSGGFNLAGPVDGIGTCLTGVEDTGHTQNIDLRWQPGDNMERKTCTFTTNEYSFSAWLNVLGLTDHLEEHEIWFDDLKLEVVSSVNTGGTTYSPYGDGGRVVMNGDRFMCTAAEVGCQGYTPLNGDPMIPAVISQEDLCPAECVGYATFTQQLDYFDIMEGNLDIAYENFIPDTAIQCPLQAVGCEEFTNLDEVAQGGEGREYYTYLRQCVLENNPGAMSYFTWEGNDVAGYQLKTWFALESQISDAPCTNITPGSDACADVPFTDDDVAQPFEEARCHTDSDNPNDDIGVDPNCREFFDEDNNSHFRLQDRVIFASNDCHDYRRSLTTQGYKAIPSLSTACSAAELGCREYYGNTANNIRNIFNDDFENGTFSPWSAGDLDISNESLSENGHSMKVSSAVDFGRDITNDNIKNKKSYQLSWWMKGDEQIDDINFSFLITDTDGGVVNAVIDTNNFTNIEGGNWHYYSTSHYIDVNNFDEALVLVASINSGGDVYLDNIMLKEVSDSITVIKDSWHTPLSCNLPDVQHLGCQAYVDTNNNTYNLKSFTRLCREEAIGCAAVIDTHNSTNPFEQTFNPSYCNNPAFTTQATCETADEVWIFEYSEITVPDDNIDYLVPDSGKYCNTDYKGCQMLGLPVRGGEDEEFYTVYKINNPDNYNNILCSADALMCEEFQSDKGTYYFKDPINDTCTYQKNVLAIFDDDPFDAVDGDEQMFDGWWLSDTLNTDNPLGCSDGQNFDELGILDTFGDLDSSNTKAALCPQSKNLCTGFRDPADPIDCKPTTEGKDGECSIPSIPDRFACEDADETWTPACQIYYYYNNDKIDQGSCNGAVDRNSGCILLYETNNWDADHRRVVTLYDTKDTYEQNIEENRPVSPIICPDFDINCDNTSNVLVKVSKDRQCSEWLSCKSADASINDETKEYVIICDKLGICDEYDGENNITKCSNWKTYEEVLALETNIYQSRTSGPAGHLNWEDLEYTGMSIPNMLPIDKLITFNFSTSTDMADSDSRLVFDACNWYDPDLWTTCFEVPAEGNRLKFAGCEGTEAEPGINNGVSCNATYNSQRFYGTCWDQTCWVNPRVRDDIVDNFKPETRGYATPDAPFPKSISSDDAGENRLQAYSKANICEKGLEDEASEDNSCEEIYKKVTFGNSQNVRYYPDGAIVPSGICTSGDTSVIPCSENFQCDSAGGRFDGRCELAIKKELVYNWSGICIEHDQSSYLVDDSGGTYNCNQWYPVQKIQGTNSLFNNYVEAGYYSPSGEDALFCAVAEPYTLPEKRTYCANKFTVGETMDHCTILIEVPVGTRVHLDKAEDYGDVIVNGYLNVNERTKYLQSPDDNGVTNEDDGPLAVPGPVIDQTGDYTDEDPSLTAKLADGLGVDFIERNDASQENYISTSYHNFTVDSKYDSLFQGEDFCREGDDCLNSRVPILPFDQIDDIFYINPAMGEVIEYFYYDEEVRYNGFTDYRAGITLPDYKRVDTYTCGNDHGNGSQTTCGIGWHEAKFSAFHARPHCGWGGPREYKKERYCNPLSYNIYVNADIQQDIQQQEEENWFCTETNCSEEEPIGKGIDCLAPPAAGNQTIYEEILNDIEDSGGKSWSWIEPKYDVDHPTHPHPECLEECDAACIQCQVDNPSWPIEACYSNNCVVRPTSTVAAMDDDSLCYNNPNCEFVYCIESITPFNPGHTTHDEYGNLVNNIDFCREYGGIEYELNDEGEPIGPVGIFGCWDRIFMLGGQEYTKITEPIDEDEPLDELYDDDLEVMDELLTDPGGVEDCLDSDHSTACVNPYTSGHCENDDSIQCENLDGCVAVGGECSVVESGIIDRASCYVVWHWPGGPFNWWGNWWVEIVCPNTYIASSRGTTCNLTSLGADGCYQQCSLVTQLDFLGNNSWVRTDVWYRSHELYPDPAGRIFDWTSYYYNSVPSIEYKEGREIFIEGLVTPTGEQTVFSPYSPFGSAWGSPANEAVVTRVPISGSSYSDLSVATFFAHDTSPDDSPSDADWNSAASRLLYLFAHAYNFVWTNEVGAGGLPDYNQIRDIYLPYSDVDIYGDPGVDWEDNPYAKEDYSPQILKVCNANELCKIVGDESITVESGITVNNLNDPGDRVFGQGSLFTGLKFFYHAHPDHMPIVNIEVDWKDSNAGFVSNPGRYKNSMESCNPDEDYFQTTSGDVPVDAIQGFGGETQACRQGYKVFYYDYSYDEDFLCVDNPLAPNINGSCYQPVVKITDRWGRFTEEAFNGWIVIHRE